ncbi:MAG: histidine kinase [Atopobiaceae bacterium]|jgi:two-component system sensor histidine kinase LytS|nr:histidine kinase [Atopobiaceae bacterium]MCH4120191.1 histidine kinase [Atopobiaceae bacterium]MCI1318705.1 histidine kinase [Atopobiaceae bacterium]MCI1389774.1 histidine kinase [Atopobiaceae bacterium]MCI1432468.1 histidine kinase [Atopobiaceae bacterium]
MRWLEQHLPSVAIAVLVVNVVMIFAVYVWSVVFHYAVVAFLSGIVLLIAIVLSAFLLLIPDDTRSQETERILDMASGTFEQMRGGLTLDTCQRACELILPETDAMAVAMTSRTKVLGYAGEMASEFPPGSPIHTKETLAVLESGQPEMFSPIKPVEEPSGAPDDVVPAGIIVPLVVQERTIGTIKFYYRQPADIDRTQVVIARGMGELLSSQLNAFALDRQSELTAIAEVKALQAQINPHFLFNTLNTIASFTRTDPDRARTLLREFATFYRQTLESSSTSIPLSREIEQTERYLGFEVARFGADRIQESSHIDPGLESLPVPGFLVQPIVENAVRHGMRDEGTLHIDIHATTDGPDVLISVIDDGVGMDEKVAEGLLRGMSEEEQEASGSGRRGGAHVALHNVAERVERFYGEGSGVEIVSKPGQGTSVTLRLADAAPQRTQGSQGARKA